jgi:hypothetical protein
MDDRAAIDELVLRLPGLAAEDARSVAAVVARKLGQGLAEALPARSLGALDLRVQVAQGTPPERLAEIVAHAIVEGLGR